MPRYNIEVVEIRHVHCLYTVEASSKELAIFQASIGNTIDEGTLKDLGISDRVVANDPIEVPDEPSLQ